MRRFNDRGYLPAKITFRLDRDKYMELIKLSYRHGFPISIIMRNLVNRFVEQEKRLSVPDSSGGAQ